MAGTYKDHVRTVLEDMWVGCEVRFPMTNRAAVQEQMADLKLFCGRLYKSKTDKARWELVVRREQ